MSDKEIEEDTTIKDVVELEVFNIELERDILNFIFYFKEYIKEKVLPVGDMLESFHIQDFLEFII